MNCLVRAGSEEKERNPGTSHLCVRENKVYKASAELAW